MKKKKKKKKQEDAEDEQNEEDEGKDLVGEEDAEQTQDAMESSGDDNQAGVSIFLTLFVNQMIQRMVDSTKNDKAFKMDLTARLAVVLTLSGGLAITMLGATKAACE